MTSQLVAWELEDVNEEDEMVPVSGRVLYAHWENCDWNGARRSGF